MSDKGKSESKNKKSEAPPIGQAEAERLIAAENEEASRIPWDEQARMMRETREAIEEAMRDQPLSQLLILKALLRADGMTFFPESFREFSDKALDLYLTTVRSFQCKDDDADVAKVAECILQAKSWAQINEFVSKSESSPDANAYRLDVCTKLEKLFRSELQRRDVETIKGDLNDTGKMKCFRGIQKDIAARPGLTADNLHQFLLAVNQLGVDAANGKVKQTDLDKKLQECIDMALLGAAAAPPSACSTGEGEKMTKGEKK